MALIRLPNVKTDILITFNDPILINPNSSSRDASINKIKILSLIILKKLVFCKIQIVI